MITRTLLLLSFIILSFLVKGQQQIVNGSFENWENTGAYAEPAGWNSHMSADMCTICALGADQCAFPDENGLNGKGLCLRIESRSALGFTVNGAITTGRITAPSARASSAFNKTVLSKPEFQLPFSDSPDSLVFWAKYSITDKSDSARVSFLLHDNFEQTDPPRDQVGLQPNGVALKTFQTAGDWQRVSVPFDYKKSGKSKTHYLLATFSSSHKAGKGNSNAKLWIDEVELIYNRSEQAFISND